MLHILMVLTLGLTPAQIKDAQVSPAGVVTVTRIDGGTQFVPTDRANTDYRAVLQWVSQGNTPTAWQPADPRPQLYDVNYSIQLQQKLLAVSQELSQNTSAPAPLTDLRNNIVRELVRLRSLPAAPITTTP